MGGCQVLNVAWRQHTPARPLRDSCVAEFADCDSTITLHLLRLLCFAFWFFPEATEASKCFATLARISQSRVATLYFEPLTLRLTR
jgi:hypothetical protein